MKSICVFCGSGMGTNPVYQETARALGHLLVKNRLALVYGGAKIGLMGTVADTVLENDGKVIGIIPDFLSQKEVVHEGLTELHVVASMHERKMLMAEKAEGFITLPGGYGTLEEVCEIITWSQLRLHEKPVAIVNLHGYYNPLLQQLDYMMQEGFLKPEYRKMLLVGDTPEKALDVMFDFTRSHDESTIDTSRV